MASKDRFKSIGVLALCLFLIPVIGWLTSEYLVSDVEAQFRQAVMREKQVSADDYENRKLSYLTFCDAARSQNAAVGKTDEGLGRLCATADEVSLVRLASAGTGAVGVLLFALILGGRRVAGTNRARMSLVFGPLVRIVMVLLAVSILTQAGLFVYCVYTIEALAIHRVHFGILIAVGIGALAACFVLLRSSFSFLKSEPMFLRAVQLNRADHPALFSLIDNTARRLKAEGPDNIVVGLEPNFFVTASDVKVAIGGEVLKGRTLFLSLGLMRLFTEAELTAVVGHELGHFKGEDVAYSMKFAPTYSRLGKALGSLSQTAGNASDLGRVPAMVALSMCLMEFASAERTVGRERELLADKAGAEAADARSLAIALVKVSLFASQWGDLTRLHVDELAKGQTFTRLSAVFAIGCKTFAEGLDWNAVSGELGKSTQPHPVDTHPPLLQRLQNLNTSLYDIGPKDCAPPEQPAIGLLNNVDAIEEPLSNLEARWLVAIGAVVVPDSPPEPRAAS